MRRQREGNCTQRKLLNPHSSPARMCPLSWSCRWRGGSSEIWNRLMNANSKTQGRVLNSGVPVTWPAQGRGWLCCQRNVQEYRAIGFACRNTDKGASPWKLSFQNRQADCSADEGAWSSWFSPACVSSWGLARFSGTPDNLDTSGWLINQFVYLWTPWFLIIILP